MNGKLFDTSAIINLCGSQNVEPLFNGQTLWLSFYEIGNAVWKQVRLQKKMSIKEGKTVLKTISDIFNAMKKISNENPEEVLQLANKTNLTFYDTVFLVAAKTNKLTLVTDDKKLEKIAKEYVPVESTRDLH